MTIRLNNNGGYRSPLPDEVNLTIELDRDEDDFVVLRAENDEFEEVFEFLAMGRREIEEFFEAVDRAKQQWKAKQGAGS